MSKADNFLWSMKERADSLILGEGPKRLLAWARDKASFVEDEYNPSAVRCYYLYLACYTWQMMIHAFKLPFAFDLYGGTINKLIRSLDSDIDFILSYRTTGDNHGLDGGVNIITEYKSRLDNILDEQIQWDKIFVRIYHSLGLNDEVAKVINDNERFKILLSRRFRRFHELILDRNLIILLYLATSDQFIGERNSFEHILGKTIDLAGQTGPYSLMHFLEKFKHQTPQGKDSQEVWSILAKNLRAVMIKERNIGFHIGYFFNKNHEQRTCLEKYYYANQLILDCLNLQCNMIESRRKKITNNLIIPLNLPETKELISAAAYFKWLDRGCPIGNDWSDWFEAEREEELQEKAFLNWLKRGKPMGDSLTDWLKAKIEIFERDCSLDKSRYL